MKSIRPALCLALALGLFGCSAGGGFYPVEGEVLVDGKPLERGNILFLPADGVKGRSAGGPITAGRYKLGADAGPAAGKHRVEIRGLKKTGKMVPKPMAPKGETVEQEVEAVAARYNVASKLEYVVKPGENTGADFKVESK